VGDAKITPSVWCRGENLLVEVKKDGVRAVEGVAEPSDCEGVVKKG
jgi:hypothetical protein